MRAAQVEIYLGAAGLALLFVVVGPVLILLTAVSASRRGPGIGVLVIGGGFLLLACGLSVCAALAWLAHQLGRPRRHAWTVAVLSTSLLAICVFVVTETVVERVLGLPDRVTVVAVTAPLVATIGLLLVSTPAPPRRLIRLPRRLVDPLYRVYTSRLWREIHQAPVPHHIAVILDGNRRFAREEGLPSLRDSCSVGARRVWEVLSWSERAGVGAVTLWAMSIDNLGRPDEQTWAIEDVVAAELRQLAPEAQRRGWRLRGIGRHELLRPETRASLAAIEAETAGNRRLVVQIAMGYGGREEIVDALRRWAHTPGVRELPADQALDSLDPDDLRAHLYGGDLPEPDLILRTSGEIRLSGFLLWQSVHAEFYFTDVLWPEFREMDFLRALRSYQGRHRRYGR